MNLVLLLIVSHTLADFVLQPDKLVIAKQNGELAGYGWHGLALAVTSLPVFALVDFGSWGSLVIRLGVMILIHLVIDYLKVTILGRIWPQLKRPGARLLLFLSDQLLHFLVIAILFLPFWVDNSPTLGRFLFLTVLFLYIPLSGAYVIPLVYDIFYAKIPDYNAKLEAIIDPENQFGEFSSLVAAGKWIGIMERVLLVAALVTNQIVAIGFIIAIKSLARFKLLEVKVFSEYYLLGTFASVVYTLVMYAFFLICV